MIGKSFLVIDGSERNQYINNRKMNCPANGKEHGDKVLKTFVTT